MRGKSQTESEAKTQRIFESKRRAISLLDRCLTYHGTQLKDHESMICDVAKAFGIRAKEPKDGSPAKTAGGGAEIVSLSFYLSFTFMYFSKHY
jgi:hypothetical protein